MNTTNRPHQIIHPASLIAGILLIAANLRAPITGVAPLLGDIRASFDLTGAEIGVITTLPLLAFAAISPFAALFAREYGIERSLFAALLVITGGIGVRSLGPAWCVFLGTLVIGSGVAIGNVLLPSLLKRDFPNRITSLTGAYALTMGVAAAIASAVAVPLARIPGLGWRSALGAIAVLPLLAILLWMPQLGGHTAPAKGTATPPHGGRIWRSALAWQVTLFMGLTSFIFYILISWLPSILADAGYSPEQAGPLHGVLQFATAVPGLLLGPMVGRMRDQRALAVGSALTATIALLGFLALPAWSMLWTILFGLGTGAPSILALAFISLRVTNAHQAAALSGMAQCLGYLLAAVGPTLMGLLHDLSGSWRGPLIISATFSLVLAVFGYLAGRALYVVDASKPPHSREPAE